MEQIQSNRKTLYSRESNIFRWYFLRGMSLRSIPPGALHGNGGCRLFDDQLLLVDDLGPGLGLGFDVLAKFLGRCRHRFEQLRRHESLLERWIAQDLAHLS